VAISDPLNVTAFDVLEQTTRCKSAWWPLRKGHPPGHRASLRSSQSLEDIVERVAEARRRTTGAHTEQDAPMIRLVDRILADASIPGRATSPSSEEKILRVRLRRDGVLSSGYLVPKEIQPALIARFKSSAGWTRGEPPSARGSGQRVCGTREIGLRFSTCRRPSVRASSSGCSTGQLSLNFKELASSPTWNPSVRPWIGRTAIVLAPARLAAVRRPRSTRH